MSTRQRDAIRQRSSRTISVNTRLPQEFLDSNAHQHKLYQPIQQYASNRIYTSKYTVLSFLPKNLFEQFRRVANSFFLLLVILQGLPEYRIINVGIVALPIVFIVAVTGLKDALEDYRRYRSDAAVNRRQVQVMGGNKWRNFNIGDLTPYMRSPIAFARQIIKWILLDFSDIKPAPKVAEPLDYRWITTEWSDIHVGDIVKLKNNDPVPADMILLSSSEPESVCFIETKNLDGETNLKLRQGPQETRMLQTPTHFGTQLQCLIETEKPNPNLTRYQCSILFRPHEGSSSKGSKISIDINGMLLRGTVVKNTAWAIAVVVATGFETKQIQNSGETPSKQSEMEKLTNKHIAFNLLFMVALCLVCSFGFIAWTRGTIEHQSIYGSSDPNPAYEGFINFWAGLILFQNIVPISLYISIEFAKTFQAYFIHSDVELYYEEKDTPCEPRSWNLADNLGQIEYVFSDKTGTLTRNIMEFKKCSIAGKQFDGESGNMLYGSKQSLSKSHRSLLIEAGWRAKSVGSLHSKAAGSVGIEEDEVDDRTRSNPGGSKGNLLGLDAEEGSEPTWFDPRLDAIMRDPHFPENDGGGMVHQFFLLLSLCHTVLVDAKGSSSSKGVLSYKAQSPDEACLVTTAAESGYVFMSRRQNSLTGSSEICVEINDQEVCYTLLNILEFDSDRKRMTVLVRDQETNDIFAYCKGADSVIFERLADQQETVMRRTGRHLERFAEEGLRTLCLAFRKIDKEFYQDWSKRYNEVQTTIFSDPSERIVALDNLNNEVESGLTLLGSTAIEDKLQDGVTECITTLMEAGVKVWMLTGDKMETAINIGFLCGLLKGRVSDQGEQVSDMVLIQIKHAKSIEALAKQLHAARKKFWASHTSLRGSKRSSLNVSHQYAVIIDGLSIRYLLEDKDLLDIFLDISCRCKTVICCRVSPLQKAKIVNMVKDNKKVVTLAIGDGANDVSMIQSAHIGVGISGEEGLQAALSADYAIAQFRFLTRLLLVHGRWSYSRNAYMILNFNLKSSAFSLVVFWFQFYCGFSSTVVYEFTYMLLYNMFFSSLPIMAIACFDRDLPDDIILQYPQIHGTEGISQSIYTNMMHFCYMFESVWQAAVVFYFAYWTAGEKSMTYDGYMPNIYTFGTYMATASIAVVNISPAMDTHAWTGVHFFVYGLCFIAFPAYLSVYATLPFSGVEGMGGEFFGEPTFYLYFVLSFIVALGPRFLYLCFTRLLHPTDGQILEEVDCIGRNHLDVGDFERPIRDQLMSTDSLGISRRRSGDPDASEVAPSGAVTYDLEQEVQSPSRGFSFSHTLGMAGLILKAPINLMSSAGFVGRKGSSSRTGSTIQSRSRPSSRADFAGLDRSFRGTMGKIMEKNRQ